MIYQGAFDPPPEGFRDRFIRDGWRGIERYYGARTAVMRRWIDDCGGLAELQARRKEWRKQQRRLAAIPRGFRETWLSGGYKAVDRHFGAPTHKVHEWLDALREAGELQGPSVASPAHCEQERHYG